MPKGIEALRRQSHGEGVYSLARRGGGSSPVPLVRRYSGGVARHAACGMPAGRFAERV